MGKFEDMYICKITASFKFGTILADYGVIELGNYYDGCFHGCLVSGAVLEKLRRLVDSDLIKVSRVIVGQPQIDKIAKILKIE